LKDRGAYLARRVFYVEVRAFRLLESKRQEHVRDGARVGIVDLGFILKLSHPRRD
jgi:hypothetical protein